MGEHILSSSVRSSEISCSRSQFYLTFKAAPHLDKKHTVFGKLVGGEEVLDVLEKLPRKEGTDRPLKPVRVTEVVMCVRKCLLCVLITVTARFLQIQRSIRGTQNSSS
jgi:hypothetical protein